MLTVEDSGRFYIWVEDINGCVDVSNLAIVNSVSLTQLFVPSIFTPNDDEHNELFKPVTAFVSDEGYSFTIYSRTGEKIFTTNDPTKGWDGKYQGKDAQVGNYVYHVEYINGTGEFTEKTDLVSLVR